MAGSQAERGAPEQDARFGETTPVHQSPGIGERDLSWSVLETHGPGIAADTGTARVDEEGAGYAERMLRLHDAGKSPEALQEYLRGSLLSDAVAPLARAAAGLESLVDINRTALALVEGRGDRIDRLCRENRAALEALVGDDVKP